MPINLQTKIILFSILTISLSSCHHDELKEKGQIVNDKPLSVPVSRSKLFLILNNNKYEFGITKPDSSQLVVGISKLLIVDNHLFILDVKSNNLFCFNINGTIQWSWNNSKEGKGPLEHDRLVDFSVRNKKIYLLNKLNEILEPDYNGKFISSKRIDMRIPYLLVNLLYVNENSQVVAYSNDLNEENEIPYSFATLDNQLTKIESVYLKKRYAKGDNVWLSSAFPLQAFTDNTGFFYAATLNDTIYTYKSGSLKRSYTVDFGDNKIPESYVNQKEHPFDEFLKKDYGGNICNIFQTDSLLSFKTTIAGQPYFHFFCKINKRVKNFKYILFETTFFTSVVQFIGSTHDRYYFIVEPDDLLSAYRYTKEKFFKSVSKTAFDQIIQTKDPVYAQLLKGINIYSNQIIVSVKISPGKLFTND